MSEAAAIEIPSTELVKSSKSPGFIRRIFSAIGRGFDALVGFASLVVGLAVISAVPLLNLLSLGFLLEVSARVAETGKLRSGFLGMRYFTRLGKIALGIWVWALPLRLVHSFWRDAELIEAGSQNSQNLRFLLAFLIVVVALHVVASVLRGGKLRHFFLPAPFLWFRWASGRTPFPKPKGLGHFFLKLGKTVGRLFRLGFFGFLGAAIWLAFPVLILVLASGAANQGLAFLGSLFGGILLGIAVLFVPFLQTRYAITNRFKSFFEVSEAKRLFRHAPVAFWLALSVTLLFALPLYLLKIELTPNEVAWLPNLFFVLFIFPARLLLGWALARAEKAEIPKHWAPRWLSRFAVFPVVAAYVFVVWLSQYLSWHGTYSLLEQHAFLVPAPLFGL